MAFSEFVKQIGNALTAEGWVTGSSFPAGTTIKFGDDEGDPIIRFRYANGEEFLLRHEMVENAFVLGMGVINTRHDSKVGLVLIYGVKYKVYLKDGKIAIITCNLEKQRYLENVLF